MAHSGQTRPIGDICDGVHCASVADVTRDVAMRQKRPLSESNWHPRSPTKRRILTFVTVSVTNIDKSRSRKGRLPEANLKMERVRCLRADLQSAPGQLRASRSPVPRPVREVHSLDWDREGRVTPVQPMRLATASQEAWPGAERKGRKPPGENRGGTPTGERIPPDAPPCPQARLHDTCACRRSASLSFVMASETKPSSSAARRLSDTGFCALRWIVSLPLAMVRRTRARIAPRGRFRIPRCGKLETGGHLASCLAIDS